MERLMFVPGRGEAVCHPNWGSGGRWFASSRPDIVVKGLTGNTVSSRSSGMSLGGVKGERRNLTILQHSSPCLESCRIGRPAEDVLVGAPEPIVHIVVMALEVFDR